jgi:hypothetical protein
MLPHLLLKAEAVSPLILLFELYLMSCSIIYLLGITTKYNHLLLEAETYNLPFRLQFYIQQAARALEEQRARYSQEC